jgi:hypothetical protein
MKISLHFTIKVVVELVKQKEIRFNFPHSFFLVIMGLNPLTVVVRKLDTIKKGFTNLYFGGAVVTDLPS